MKIGVMIEGQEGLTWDRWRALIRAADDLGFDGLWRSDHFMSLMGRPERTALETFTSLTLAAAESRRIRFGTLVASMTFRHPALLARMAAALDDLSGGRFVLGIGAGWNEPEHTAFGQPFPPLRERMDRLEESAAVLRALEAPTLASYDGHYYQLKDAQITPKPAGGRFRLLVGGRGEQRTLRIVARYADIWNAPGMTPDLYRAKADVLADRCAEVGRDPAAIEHTVMLGYVIGADEAALARRFAAIQEIVPALQSVAAADAEATLRERGWLYGTPAAISEQLAALAEAGVQGAMLQHFLQDDREALELLARDVLPAVSGQ